MTAAGGEGRESHAKPGRTRARSRAGRRFGHLMEQPGCVLRPEAGFVGCGIRSERLCYAAARRLTGANGARNASPRHEALTLTSTAIFRISESQSSRFGGGRCYADPEDCSLRGGGGSYRNSLFNLWSNDTTLSPRWLLYAARRQSTKSSLVAPNVDNAVSRTSVCSV